MRAKVLDYYVEKYVLLLPLVTICTFVLLLFSTGLSWANAHGEEQLPPEEVITLNQAIEIAVKNNRSLVKSSLGVKQSTLSVQTQKTAFDIKVQPLVGIGYDSSDDENWIAGFELSKQTEVGIAASLTPRVQRSGNGNRASVGVAVSVPLLSRFGRERRMDGVYSAEYGLENTKSSFYQQQVSTVLETVSSVYTIIKNEQQISFLKNQINHLNTHLGLIRIKEKSGLASAMDLYRAEIRLKDIQNELTTTQEQLQNSIDQLKSLLAISLNKDLTVTASIDYEPVVIDSDEAVEIAMKNRIELEQATRQIGESKRKLLLAKKNLLPQLDLNMRYNKFDENREFDLDEEFWTVSIQGDSDLFRKLEKVEFQRAKINHRQAEIDLDSEKDRIAKEVRAQVNMMERREKLIADRRELARQAEGKLELAASKFRHGMADNFDLLEAQTQRQQVLTSLLFDRIGYITDTYRLRSVLGTLIARQENN